MGCKKHVPLILIALVLAVLAFSGTRIPQAFAAVQKSFVLDLDSANFTFLMTPLLQRNMISPPPLAGT
jgi:hypothetical protein